MVDSDMYHLTEPNLMHNQRKVDNQIEIMVGVMNFRYPNITTICLSSILASIRTILCKTSNPT